MTDTPTTPACPGPRAGTQADKPPEAMTDAELAEACEREIARLDAEEAARVRYGIG